MLNQVIFISQSSAGSHKAHRDPFSQTFVHAPFSWKHCPVAFSKQLPQRSQSLRFVPIQSEAVFNALESSFRLINQQWPGLYRCHNAGGSLACWRADLLWADLGLHRQEGRAPSFRCKCGRRESRPRSHHAGQHCLLPSPSLHGQYLASIASALAYQCLLWQCALCSHGALNSTCNLEVSCRAKVYIIRML